MSYVIFRARQGNFGRSYGLIERECNEFDVPESKTAGFSAIKAANLIPAIFIPWAYLALEGLFS
jgi:hypothetical protein